MEVRPGFQGWYKQSEWLPVVVDLDNRGREVSGVLSIGVPNPFNRTQTTYLRPVVLGARSRKRHLLYVRGGALSGALVVTLNARGGRRAQANLSPLGENCSLIVVLNRERGALSFLSGPRRGPGRVRAIRPAGYGGTPPSPEIRVADAGPDDLPDLPCGFAAVDMLVIGDVSARDFPAEVKDAVTKWVSAGGTLIVMGGPDWARLRDPFFRNLLPVEAAGAAQVAALDALSATYGAGLEGAAVITRSAPRRGASVRLLQDGIPLIAERPVGCGRVVFLAFDATKPPLRGWNGQNSLWNDLLSQAESVTPVLAVLSSGPSPSYYGGQYGGPSRALAASVMNIPAMQTPPFWWVAAFLAAYVVLLVPVNYSVLKWRRRRELAWVTTPAIVVVFSLLAYVIGFSMKGGRLLVNQLSVLETRAGARTARMASYAGLFSPAMTSYDLGTPDSSAVISDASLDPYGRGGKNLTVSEAETISLSRVPMDMWSMRVFQIDGVADLGGGLEADLALSQGTVQGQVTNRTGLHLEGCNVTVGGQAINLGDLPAGHSKKISLHIGPGIPSAADYSTAPGPSYRGLTQSYRPGATPAGPSAEEEMRTAVAQALQGAGVNVAQGGGAVLTAWARKGFAGLTVNGRTPRPTSVSFLICHMPLRSAQTGPFVVPYGIAEGAVVEQTGTQQLGGGPGLPLQDGYIVKEFRLPLQGRAVKVDQLEVFCQFTAPGYTPGPPAGAAVAPGVVATPGGRYARIVPPTTATGIAPASAGSPKPGTVVLAAYNWQTGAWDTLAPNTGNVLVPNPAAHVGLPEGLVRVKLSRPGASLSGRVVWVNRLDVSLRGQVR